MGMGKNTKSTAKAAAWRSVGLALLLGALLISLPLWAGKIDPWRQWAAAAIGLTVGAAGVLLGGARVGRGGGLLAAGLLVAAVVAWWGVCPLTSARTLLWWLGGVCVLMAAWELGAAGLSGAVMGTVTASLAVVALWAVREYAFTVFATGDWSWRPFGPFVNPNALAGYLIVALPAGVASAVWLWRIGRERQPGHPARLAVLACWTVVGFTVVALLLTASKGALLAAVVASFFVGVQSGRSRYAAAGVLAAVIVALAVPPVRARLTAAFTTQRGTSLGFRVQTWAGTARMAIARPLTGWGAGCFRHAYPRFARVPFTSMAHCSWLQAAAECGLPAALLLLGAFAWMARAAAFVRTPWGLTAAWSAAAFVVHNLVDYTLYLPAVMFTVLAVAGAAGGCAASAREGVGEGAERGAEAAPNQASRGGLRAPVVAVLLVGAAFSLWFLVAHVRGARAAALAQAGFYHAAAERSLRAAELAGISRDLWVETGKIVEGLAGVPPDHRLLKRAAQAYLNAIVAAPTDPAGWIGVARCWRLAGEPGRGVAFAQAAVQAYPRGPAALLELARCLEAAGQVARAVQVYQRVANLAWDSYGAYPPLEGWADYRIGIAAVAVARASDARSAMRYWRVAGRVFAQYLSWSEKFARPGAPPGLGEPAVRSQVLDLAADVAAALEASSDAGDEELARKLRTLARLD